ncbi:MAG TPA: matrixin family metalloprotease [Thermoanaerobaculia bacterium]|nr:matrixin family metalloprotease [Thermoanaerobaculia bacterium]
MRTIRLLALILLLIAPSVSATSYVPMTDAALVDQAPVIAVVEVRDSGPGPESPRPSTGYRVRVERVLKGALAPGLGITVRVPGGVRADGLAQRIWGAPRFTKGERALLFLSPRIDGTYDVVNLMLGAFHEVRTGKHRLAVRHLSEARPIARPGQSLPREPLRDFERFVRWIAGRVRGIQVRADYMVDAGSLGQITAPYTLFEDSFDGYNLRWFVFDDSGSVQWRAHQDGQQGVAGGGFAEFQTALAAWNDDPNSNISYTYAGTTANTNGLINYDTVNVILFNDPNNELPAFNCGSGGVLAYGGPWYETDTTSFQGILFHRSVNADIVTNNGIACFFAGSPNASKAAEELFAHELGHTLGIDHSAVFEALMYPFIHNDGRGALLHADDREAIAYLYPSPASPADFFTVTPCRLLDTREPNGPYGGPVLNGASLRTFIAAGQCGIPASAVALSVNVTAVSPTGGGNITLFASDLTQPNTPIVNFSPGQTRTNNGFLLLSKTPARSFTAAPVVVANGLVHLVVDVNGYFEEEP